MGKLVIFICCFFTAIAEADDCIQALRSVRKTNLPTMSKEEVVTNLEDAIKHCPKLVEAYYEYGRFYLSNAKYSEAEEKFKKADSLKPKLEFVLGIAYSQWGRKDYSSAENTYKDAIGRYSGDWRLLQGLSVLYLSIGRAKEAEELLRQALQEESGVGSIYFNLGMALMSLNRDDEAMTSMKTAISKDPALPQASLALAQLYLKRDQYNEARAIIEPALLHNPNDSKLLEMMLSILDLGGDISDARAFVNRSSNNLSDVRKRVYNNIFDIKLGEVDRALSDFKNLSDSYPKDGIVLGAYGWALATVGKGEAAEQVLLKAIELNENDAFSINNLGVVYEKKGLRDKAKAMFEKASIALPYAKIIQENVERLQ